MPFAFPITENRFGDLFAQGISNAINTYRQGQELKRQRTLTELQNPGFHFGNMPTVADAARTMGNQTIPSSSVDTSVVMPSTQGGGVQLTPSGTPLHISSPAVSISQPSQFQSNIAGALASMPKRERNAPASNVYSDRYIPVGDNAYINADEARRRMSLSAEGLFAQSLMRAMGQASGNPVETNYKLAETNLANRRGAYYDARANAAVNPHTKPVPWQIRRGKEGYFQVDPVTGDTRPLVDDNGDPIMPFVAPSRSSTLNPNAETPAHRNARQAAAATLPILRNTQAQMVPLQKQLGSQFATAADSARIGPMLGNLQQRVDSLQQAYAGHVHDMDAAAGGASSTPAPKQLPPLTAAQKARAARDPQFKTFLGRQGYQEPDFR